MITAAVLRTCPRTHQGVVEEHPWHAAYAATVAAVCGPRASAATMRDWVAAAAAEGRAGKYRSRALLVLAVYDECWLNGRPCPVLTAWTAAPELHAPLAIEPQEAILLRFLAAGPVRRRGGRGACALAFLAHLCAVQVPGGFAPPHGSAEDLPFLFSSESLDPNRDSPDLGMERSAFILALAVILGVPRERNYYHMAAFEPGMLDSREAGRTQGLGSGHSCV